MIVGEAPGKTEIKQGKPFVGPSGRLLWGSLQTFGITRAECSVTNSLCCYIPAKLYDKKTSYIKEPAAACRPRLLDEVRRAQPKVILALGNVAMQSLLNDFSLKITQERGRVATFDDGNGFSTKLVATLHPAAILRNVHDYRKFRRDLAYVSHLAKGGEPKSPGETKYEVVWTPPDVWPAIEKIRAAAYQNGGIVAADIETNSLDPLDGRILALGVAYDKNKVVIFRGHLLGLIHPLLSDERLKWVWHNGKFDTKFLQRNGLPGRVDHDTMLLHFTTDEEKGTHDLKQLATYLLGASDYSTKFKKFLPEKGMTFADAPSDALHEYLSKDCDYTYQAFQLLSSVVLEDPDSRSLYENILIPLSRFLLRVEQRGIWASPEYIDELEVELSSQQVQIEELIYTQIEGFWDELDYAYETKAVKVPENFNPGSHQQLGWLLYKSMGLWPSNGRKDTQEETLSSIQGSDFVETILKWKKLRKRLGTYVLGMREAISLDGRVHATFNIHGTVTGRLSSSDPNMQNIPRTVKGEPYPIKSIFQGPEGRYLIDMDLAQAELRVLAVVSNDPFLKEVFNSGRDLHDETAAKLFGKNFTKEERVRAKSTNFGICYGLTEYSLQQSFHITYRDANKMITGWADAYPLAWKYLQEQREIPAQGKYCQSPLGRRRRFPLVTKDVLNELQNEASNFSIQATASDLNLLLAMSMEEALAELDAYVVNIVHDSIVVECPENIEAVGKVLSIAQEKLDEVVVKWLKTDVRFGLSGDYGRAWGSLEPFTR